MKSKEVSVSVKWPFQVSKFQFGHCEMFELVEVEEGEDPDYIRSQLFNILKNQAQEEIGKALDEIHNPPRSQDVQYAPEQSNNRSRNRRSRHGS